MKGEEGRERRREREGREKGGTKQENTKEMLLSYDRFLLTHTYLCSHRKSDMS
jgi:hypothetical protein